MRKWKISLSIVVIIVCVMIPLEKTFGEIFEIRTAVNPANNHSKGSGHKSY